MPISITWNESDLYVGGLASLFKVTKAEHYSLHEIKEISTTEGVFEKVSSMENGLLITQNKATLIFSQLPHFSKLLEFKVNQLSAWSCCADLAVGVKANK